MNKLIQLNSKKYPGMVSIVDDIFYEEIMKYTWRVAVFSNNKNFYAATYFRDTNCDKLLHRFILKIVHGDITGKIVDHINGDGLDNRLENLRLCTPTENCQNQRRNKQNESSNYKGVSYRKDSNVFRARIRHNKNLINLGQYNSEIEAALVYNKKAQELFGEFASLNVIEGEC